MLRILHCVGVDQAHSPRFFTSMLYDSESKKAAATINRVARGRAARREAEALRRREVAKKTIARTVRKQSRRGMGLFSARHTTVAEDERALVYAKPGQQGLAKTLPFADMEPAHADGSVTTIKMRHQAADTAVYKFQSGSASEAKKWADAVNVFVPKPTPPPRRTGTGYVGAGAEEGAATAAAA